MKAGRKKRIWCADRGNQTERCKTVFQSNPSLRRCPKLAELGASDLSFYGLDTPIEFVWRKSAVVFSESANQSRTRNWTAVCSRLFWQWLWSEWSSNTRIQTVFCFSNQLNWLPIKFFFNFTVRANCAVCRKLIDLPAQCRHTHSVLSLSSVQRARACVCIFWVCARNSNVNKSLVRAMWPNRNFWQWRRRVRQLSSVDLNDTFVVHKSTEKVRKRRSRKFD